MGTSQLTYIGKAEVGTLTTHSSKIRKYTMFTSRSNPVLGKSRETVPIGVIYTSRSIPGEDDVELLEAE